MIEAYCIIIKIVAKRS